METNGYPNGTHDDLDLAQFDDDFESAEVEEPDFDEPPDGRYQVIVDKVELTRSKTANNPMLKWQLKILGPQCAGRFLFRNSMIVSPENLKWLKSDLYICGLELKKLSDLPAHLSDLLDVTLEVKKQTRGEYVNIYFQKRIEIDVPPGAASGQSAGDDAAADILPF